MARSKDLHEGKVSRCLHLTIFRAIIKLQVCDFSLVERLLSRPLEGISPSLVTKPVADEVSITSIDQHWNLLQDLGHEAVEGLHPIALEQEVSVNIEIATVVAGNFGTKLGHDALLVQVFGHIVEGNVAEVASLTLSADAATNN